MFYWGGVKGGGLYLTHKPPLPLIQISCCLVLTLLMVDAGTKTSGMPVFDDIIWTLPCYRISLSFNSSWKHLHKNKCLSCSITEQNILLNAAYWQSLQTWRIQSVDGGNSFTVEHPKVAVVTREQAGFARSHYMIPHNISTKEKKQIHETIQ